MNPRESESAIREAFTARLAAAPPPPDAVFVRVLNTIDTPSPERGAFRTLRLPRPLPVVAGVARFAAATAIVVSLGTVAFGSVTMPRDLPAMPAAMQATEVTFEQSLPAENTIVYRGSMALTVDDTARTVHRIGTIVAREKGAVIAGTAVSAPSHTARASLRLVVRVPAQRLRVTMRALGALGGIVAQSVESDDLSATVAANARRLLRARDVERALEAGGMPPRLATVRSDAGRLSSQQDALDARIAYATLAVTVIPTSSGTSPHELSLGAVRRTITLLARGVGYVAQGPLHVRDGVRDLDAPASAALAAGSRFGGAATRGNGRSDRA